MMFFELNRHLGTEYTRKAKGKTKEPIKDR